MHEAKTYRQYIEQTPFESVWGVLRVQYGETEDVRQSYIDLCEELKTLPPSPKCKPIIIRKSKCSRVSKRKVHFTKRSV